LPFHLKTYYKGYPVAIYIHYVGGNERFLSLTQQYVRQLHGVIMVCSLSPNEKNSFQNIEHRWHPFVKEYGKDNIVPFIVCNKHDIFNTNQNNKEYSKRLSNIENFANQANISFLNASAQTGFNVKRIFNKIVLQILQNQQIFEELVDQKIYHKIVDNNTRRQYRRGSIIIDETHMKRRINNENKSCCLNS